jgi:hypothetical protein
MSGHPALHRELMWYATDDDAVIGVVILDLVDRDYSWVRSATGSRPSSAGLPVSRPSGSQRPPAQKYRRPSETHLSDADHP